MYKNNAFIFSLAILTPFFIKGIRDSSKESNISRYNDFSKTVFTTKYHVEPLVSDCKIECKTAKTFELKMDMNPGLAYDLSKLAITIDSFEDKSVTYTRSDSSGFVRKSGSRTWRNMNPGAIRTSPFTRAMGACGDAGGFAVFPSEEQGMKALKALLKTESYSNLSIYDAVHKYAPFCDSNDPIKYQRDLYNRTHINCNRKLGELSDEELDRVAYTIKVLEGWREGQEEHFGAMFDVFQEIVNKQKQYNS